MKKLLGGFRDCACGCGERIPRAVRSSAPVGKEIEYIAYHHAKGKKLGEDNPMWKGDKVGLNALHRWVAKRLPKPELCQRCKKVPPHDLANKTDKYLRDLDDWQWLCCKCHMATDDRLQVLHRYYYRGYKNKK